MWEGKAGRVGGEESEDFSCVKCMFEYGLITLQSKKIQYLHHTSRKKNPDETVTTTAINTDTAINTMWTMELLQIC